MNQLIWSPKFKKSAERFLKQNPQLFDVFKSTIREIEANPFQSSLKTHKLKGRLNTCFASSINYDYRIVFKLSESDSKCIELLNIGTHDEVY